MSLFGDMAARFQQNVERHTENVRNIMNGTAEAIKDTAGIFKDNLKNHLQNIQEVNKAVIGTILPLGPRASIIPKPVVAETDDTVVSDEN